MEPILVKPKTTPAQVARMNKEFPTKYGEDEPSGLESGAYEVIKRHEGFKSEPYRDTKGKWTIGIGTLIGDGSEAAYKKSPYYKKSINEMQAAEIARQAIKDKIALSESLLGKDYLYSLSPNLQEQIVSSVYRGSLSGSPNTVRLLKEGKFEEASKQYVDNDEYRKSKAKTKDNGVYKRMDEAAAAMAAEPKQGGFEDAVEKRLNKLSK